LETLRDTGTSVGTAVLDAAGLTAKNLGQVRYATITYDYLLRLCKNPPEAKTDDVGHQILATVLLWALYAPQNFELWWDENIWPVATAWFLGCAAQSTEKSAYGTILADCQLLRPTDIPAILKEVRFEALVPDGKIPRFGTKRWMHWLYLVGGFYEKIVSLQNVVETSTPSSQVPVEKDTVVATTAQPTEEAKAKTKGKNKGKAKVSIESEEQETAAATASANETQAVATAPLPLKEALGQIRLGTWNCQGLRVMDHERASLFVAYVQLFDIFLLQEVGAGKGKKRLTKLGEMLPDGWLFFHPEVSGHSQANVILCSPNWKRVLVRGSDIKLMATALDANKFPHPPMTAFVQHRNFPEIRVCVTSLHTSPSGSVNGKQFASNPLPEVERYRAEISDTVAAVVAQMKDWGLPYNEGSAKALGTPVPLILVGGDFNLYAHPTNYQPGIRCLAPPPGGEVMPLNRAGRTTRRAALGLAQPTEHLAMFTAPMSPHMNTSTSLAPGGQGSPYDGYLINTAFLRQENTCSYPTARIQTLGSHRQFSDHHPTEVIIMFQ